MVDIRIDCTSRHKKQPVYIQRNNAGGPPDSLDNIFTPPLALYEPTKCKIKTHIRSHIFRFLTECGIKISQNLIPQVMTAYRAAETLDGSHLAFELIRPRNATRSRSYAEYLWRNSDYHQLETFHGRVLMFMSFHIKESCYPELFLALVQDFHCENPGRLKRIVPVERQDIICACDVLGMVAVMKNGVNGHSYIVKQRTALIG